MESFMKETIFMSGSFRLASPAAAGAGVAGAVSWAAPVGGFTAAATCEVGGAACPCWGNATGRANARTANTATSARIRRERITRPIRPVASQVCICKSSKKSNVDFYRLTTFYRQFPNRASTSRTSGLRLGRVGIIGWSLQKPLLPPTWTSPSKTRFYNMLGKEDQTRNWVTGIGPSAEKHAQLYLLLAEF